MLLNNLDSLDCDHMTSTSWTIEGNKFDVACHQQWFWVCRILHCRLFDKAKEAAGEAYDKAKEMAESAVEKTDEMVDKAKEGAENLADSASESVKNVATEIKEGTEDLIDGEEGDDDAASDAPSESEEQSDDKAA